MILCYINYRKRLFLPYFILILQEINSLQIIKNDTLPVPSLIKRHGYQTETHEVLTEDGYILSLHRIPNPGQRPILLNHGLLGSSYTYLFLGPGQALAYKLYEAGYDVWLGNFRGNFYSRKHKFLNNTQFKFWQFGIHEMGIYDIPTEIDYISETTGYNKVDYVGFSLGAMCYWILMSEKPEYNMKINQMHALAPMAYWGSKQDQYSLSKSLMTSTLNYLKYQRIGEVLPLTRLNNMLSNVCSLNYIINPCSNLYMYLFARGATAVSQSVVPEIIKGHPAGTSTRTLEHAVQLIGTGKFRAYDFGSKKMNMIMYNSTSPPDYNLRKVTSPVFIQYVEKDTIALSQNVKRLCKKIANCAELHRVPDLNLAHDDLTFGKSSPRLVYDYILKILATL